MAPSRAGLGLRLGQIYDTLMARARFRASDKLGLGILYLT